MAGQSSVGRVDLDLGINYSQFRKDARNIPSKAGGMLKSPLGKIAKIAGAAFIAKGMFDFGSKAIGLASDLAEVQNVVDVTFGNMAESIGDFSKSAIFSFGLSELSAKKFTSTMGAMLKSSGLTGTKMRDMSVSLAQLSGDMASFYNLDPEEAFQKIQSGISGETEPLKRLGINMNVANLEAYALSKGITQSYNAMDQATQIMLRYEYLMQATSDAQGDFARTSNSWANQTRILKEQFKSFMATLGSGFMAILTPVIKMLNGLIARLIVAAEYFKRFVELITGVKQEASSTAAAVAAMSSGMDDVGAETKAAGKAVKGSLGAFDQLNTLTQSAAGALGDMSSGMSGFDDISLGSVEDSDADLTPFERIAQRAAAKFEEYFIAPLANIDFTNLKESAEGMRLALEPLGAMAFEGLVWGYNNFLVPIATWTVEDFLPSFLNALAAGFTATSQALSAAQPALENIWNKVLVPMGNWAGGLVISSLEILTDRLVGIGNWMEDNPEKVQTMTYVIAGFFAAFKLITLTRFAVESALAIVQIVKMAGKFAALTVATIASKAETIILMGLYAKDFVVAAGKTIGKLVVMTAKWVAQTIAVGASTIAIGATTVATKLFSIAAGAGAFAAKAFSIALAVLTSPVTLVIVAVAALVAGIYLLIKHWDDVKLAASVAWDWIKNVWSGAATWFNDTVIAPIAGFFGGLWSSITDGIQRMTDKLNIFKGDASKAQIAGANPTSQYYYNPSPATKKTSGILTGSNKPMMLASGGIVTAPTLAMMGEGKKKEAVIPLENSDFINKFAATIASAVAQSMPAGNGNAGSSEPGVVVLKIGETELGRATIKAINQVQRQTGVTLLTL